VRLEVLLGFLEKLRDPVVDYSFNFILIHKYHLRKNKKNGPWEIYP
jgi:hypothetical protein